MITLNDREKDALIELCNIGMSKAAKQLSILLNDEIDMHTPDLLLATLPETATILKGRAHAENKDIACVFQKLEGLIDGRALLFFHEEDSKTLVNILLDNSNIPVPTVDRQTFEHEALVEIGNIIISSCLSTLANFLGEEIVLSTPTYVENSVDDILSKHADMHELDNNDEPRFLAITTFLHASKKDITGSLIIVYTLKSIKTLINKLDSFVEATKT